MTVITANMTSLSIEVVYVCWLPKKNVVLHDQYLGSSPMRYSGNLDMFTQSAGWKLPITIDLLTAATMEWITPQELLDEMPWLDQKIQAALRLVL